MNTKASTRRHRIGSKHAFIVKIMPWFIGAICMIANAIALVSVAARAQ